MLKRLAEAKEMLLGPQHEPEPILKALFTRDETVISEPDEKKTKREKPQLKQDEVERALQMCPTYLEIF